LLTVNEVLLARINRRASDDLILSSYCAEPYGAFGDWPTGLTCKPVYSIMNQLVATR